MSAAPAPVSLRVIPPQPDGAVRRVHLLMRQREALRPLFRVAWDNLAGRFDADELEGWAAGVLALADVNAGPSCLVAFWELSRNHADRARHRRADRGRATAANICRHAGAQAARPAYHRAVDRRAAHPGAGAACLALVARDGRSGAARAGIGRGGGSRHGRNPRAAGDIHAFESFVAAGLKLGGQRQAHNGCDFFTPAG